MQDIENELAILKQKLVKMNQQAKDPSSHLGGQEDPVLGQFAQILDKYDQKVYHLRQSAQRNYASGRRGHKVDSSAFNSMRADATEAEKIKTDLSQLRKEIEMADLEDEETYR